MTYDYLRFVDNFSTHFFVRLWAHKLWFTTQAFYVLSSQIERKRKHLSESWFWCVSRIFFCLQPSTSILILNAQYYWNLFNFTLFYWHFSTQFMTIHVLSGENHMIQHRICAHNSRNTQCRQYFVVVSTRSAIAAIHFPSIHIAENVQIFAWILQKYDRPEDTRKEIMYGECD